MTSYYCTVCALLLVFIPPSAKAVRVYTFLPNPRENPDYERYSVPHPSLEVFNPLPQFATLRSLPLNNTHLINYTQLIDKYCLNPNTALGGILWPINPDFMFADNHKDFIQYIQDKGLYITSVHGFSPVVAGYRPPKDVLESLEELLGEKWFGMANGEQDGHYTGAFADQELPLNKPSVDQYMNFRDYFNKMEDILGPRLTTLLSSTYPHYQLKTGLYTLAGAETSQHGPNAQLRYSFIRGAGKQYGVLWFGNVSIYNRFGHKVYDKKSSRVRERKNPQRDVNAFLCTNDTSVEGYGIDLLGDPFGPTCGTSLNLIKRLMYAQMMYNSGYASIEGGWFYDDNKGNELSPIGLIQHGAFQWVSKKSLPTLGTHLATVAVYLDYFNGWAAPRQKRGVIYRTWTNLPYTQGDYLTDGLERLMYPSYQDASYFHNEAGVSSPTPYGDIVDIVLSDAPTWVLKRYDTIFVSSQLRGGAEVASNLLELVQQGSNLVVTANNLASMPTGYFSVSVKDDCKKVKAGEKVHLYWQQEPITERYNMTVCALNYTQPATVLAWLEDGTPLAVLVRNSNGGSLTVLATPYALSSSQAAKPVSAVDQTLSTPFPLLDHATVILHKALQNASIVQTTANLSVVTNYIDKDELLVLVSNPALRQQPLQLAVPNGEITSVKEVILDQAEKGQVGYLPDGYENTDIGKSTPTTIAGGDTRLFQLTTTLKLTMIAKPVAKPRPVGVALHLRHIDLSLRREILTRPSFFQHYDSVVIDYSYLITKDNSFLSKEREWLQTQRVKVYVDATPSINLFPTIRFTTDAPDLYNQSITSLTELLYRMYTLGAQRLIISLHLFPGDQSKDSTFEQFNATLHYLLNQAKTLNITLHFLDTPKNQFDLLPLSRRLDEFGLSSLTFVLNTARLLEYTTTYKYDTILTTRTSMLYINAPGWDLFGMKYTGNELISKNETTKTEISQLLKHICSLVCCPYRTTSDNQFKVKNQRTVNKGHIKKDSKFEQYQMVTNCEESDILPIVMDSLYQNQDQEFIDTHIIEQFLASNN